MTAPFATATARKQHGSSGPQRGSVNAQQRQRHGGRPGQCRPCLYSAAAAPVWECFSGGWCQARLRARPQIALSCTCRPSSPSPPVLPLPEPTFSSAPSRPPHRRRPASRLHRSAPFVTVVASPLRLLLPALHGCSGSRAVPSRAREAFSLTTPSLDPAALRRPALPPFPSLPRLCRSIRRGSLLAPPLHPSPLNLSARRSSKRRRGIAPSAPVPPIPTPNAAARARPCIYSPRQSKHPGALCETTRTARSHRR